MAPTGAAPIARARANVESPSSVLSAVSHRRAGPTGGTAPVSAIWNTAPTRSSAESTRTVVRPAVNAAVPSGSCEVHAAAARTRPIANRFI